MMSTVVFLTLLPSLPAQPGPLSLTNVQTAFGLLGPIRPDTKVLPGDTVVVEFDIQGISVDPAGKVAYSMALEVTDSKGKVHFRQNPVRQQAVASLGGNTVPGFAQFDIGLNQPAGTYSAKVTVIDEATKKSQSLTQQVQVTAPDFGLVRVNTTCDPEGAVPAGLVSVGEAVWVNFAAVHFGRDKAKGQPNLAFTMTVLDDKGKPTRTTPDGGVVNSEVPDNEKFLAVQFELSLNRTGKFTVQLQATDKVSGKTANLSFPLMVYPNR